MKQCASQGFAILVNTMPKASSNALDKCREAWMRYLSHEFQGSCFTHELTLNSKSLRLMPMIEQLEKGKIKNKKKVQLSDHTMKSCGQRELVHMRLAHTSHPSLSYNTPLLYICSQFISIQNLCLTILWSLVDAYWGGQFLIDSWFNHVDHGEGMLGDLEPTCGQFCDEYGK